MKLYHMTFDERLKALTDRQVLSAQDYEVLMQSYHHSVLNDRGEVIEQMIGTYPQPLAIVEQLPMNGDLVSVVMSIEQLHIVPGLNNAAKWVRNFGELCTACLSKGVMAQLFYKRSHMAEIQKYIQEQKELILLDANTTVASLMRDKGGGLKEMAVRCVNETECVLEIIVDAVGYRAEHELRRIGDWLAARIKDHISCQSSLTVVSRYTPQQLYQAEIFLHGFQQHVCEDIVHKFELANDDVARALNNNLSIANAVTAVLSVTGNDTRALSGNMHAYAARSGSYKPLSHFSCTDDGMLYGSVTMPIMAAVEEGGAVIHPMAKRCMDIMQIQSVDDLAFRALSCGLLANFAALYQHVKRHQEIPTNIRTHCKKIALQLDVSPLEFDHFVSKLESSMRQAGKLTVADAKDILIRMRSQSTVI